MTGSKRLPLIFGGGLILSLGLNLFLLGLIAGGALRPPPPIAAHEAPALNALLQPRKMIEPLPLESKRAVRRAFRAERATLRPLFREFRDKRRAVVSAMEDRPVDWELIRTRISEAEDSERRLRQEVVRVVTTILSDLPAEEQELVLALASERMTAVMREAEGGLGRGGRSADGPRPQPADQGATD